MSGWDSLFDYASKKPLHKYSAMFGGSRGLVTVFDEGIVIQASGRNTVVRANYVHELSKLSDEPFSKVKAELAYYDMFGNLEHSQFVLNANDFLALKQDLRK